MSKYSFIKKSNKVWHNDDIKRLMQVCNKVPKVINDETLIPLISLENKAYEEEISIERIRADELKPYLKEFDKGYWCAIQDACANNVSDTAIKNMLLCAGFTYDECMQHIEDSGLQNDTLLEIVKNTFPMTLERLMDRKDFEPEFLQITLSNRDTVCGMVIDEVIDHKRGTAERYIYDIRKADNSDDLSTIEKIVRVNRECTIAVDKPIEMLENEEYLEIDDWSYQDWKEAAEYALSNAVKSASTRDIDNFINDYWENLETFEKNIETFKQCLGLTTP